MTHPSLRIPGIRTSLEAALVGAAVSVGCGSTSAPPNLGASVSGPTDATYFANAQVLELKLGETIALSGEVKEDSAADAFDIGPVGAGERIIVELDPRDGLDPAVGLFDEDGGCIQVNDDRNAAAGDVGSRLTVQVRRDLSACFVIAAPSFKNGLTGRYALRVTRAGLEPLDEPEPQQVYLNFDGADAVSLDGGLVPIPAFETSTLARRFDGRIEELIEAVVGGVRSDYAGLRVSFVSSRESPPPAEPHTTVHFGAYDSPLFGTADYVDEFNATLSQTAIVFVDTFEVLLDLEPSLEEMAAALANVASHEAGHLMGLNHTTDPLEIMSVTASLEEMLMKQSFYRSPLHREVFPVGYQDSAQLLVDAVGGDLVAFKASHERSLAHRERDSIRQGELTVRPQRPFSTCCGRPSADGILGRRP